MENVDFSKAKHLLLLKQIFFSKVLFKTYLVIYVCMYLFIYEKRVKKKNLANTIVCLMGNI